MTVYSIFSQIVPLVAVTVIVRKRVLPASMGACVTTCLDSAFVRRGFKETTAKLVWFARVLEHIKHKMKYFKNSKDN